MVTSLNIFRFSLGVSSQNLDLECPASSSIVRKRATAVANCVYIVTLEMSFPHAQSAFTCKFSKIHSCSICHKESRLW